MRRIAARIITTGFLLFLAQVSYASVVGSGGAVYPIHERDSLEELQERIRQMDWNSHLEGLAISLKAYRPVTLHPLPKAKEDRTLTVDLTYTLEFDIPDGNGGILFPKGYTFNPLDYAVFPNTLVFIDGGDTHQVAWFRSSGYAKNPRVMLLLTGGSHVSVSGKLQRPVFYATRQIAERFRLQAVPSVLQQKGRIVEVKEFAIEHME